MVREKKVIVCCGAGGVGKTTTAAALGLAGARAGRRVLVLTVDPARRLAEAMRIPPVASGPTPVPPEKLAESGVEPPGSLHAWMLNPGTIFENMVRRLSPSPERAERILQNRLYRHMSDMVAGMQEYTAAEALYELSNNGEYDLVILDTPPSRNALEFLEAPGRLARFLDERVLAFFLPDGSRRSGLWRKASELINNVAARVLGQGFFEELRQFLGAFSGMFAAMRSHADGVRAMLASPEAAFLLVTSPDQVALTEADFMRDKILELELPFSGFVLNRSWAFEDGLIAPEAIELPLGASEAMRTGFEKLLKLAKDERARAERDRLLLARIREHAPPGAIAVAAPHLGDSIDDLRGLTELAKGLVAGR
jgi:anion-transporting  ArsA/GET3 family ATPase